MPDFNPRSREGSDDSKKGVVSVVEDFNPRSREGSDVEAIDCRPIRADFNPRSREGSDVEVERMWYKVVKFQSTLPRRERRNPMWLYVRCI